MGPLDQPGRPAATNGDRMQEYFLRRPCFICAEAKLPATTVCGHREREVIAAELAWLDSEPRPRRIQPRRETAPARKLVRVKG